MKLICLSLLFFSSFISEIKCKRYATNANDFKIELILALKLKNVDININDIDEYSNYVAMYPSKLNKYDIENFDEIKSRYTIYQNTKERIKILNQNIQSKVINGRLFEQKYGITQFADMTQDEKRLMFKTNERNNNNNNKCMHDIPCVHTYSNKYESIDPFVNTAYTNKQYCAPVKDQGYTNGCWAFATISQAECNLNRELYGDYKNPGHISLSEQHVVDCTTNYEGTMCDGGYPDRTIEHMSNNGGFCSRTDYEHEWINYCDWDNPKNNDEWNDHCYCDAAKYVSKCEMFYHNDDNDIIIKAATNYAWTFAMLLPENFYDLKGENVAYFSCDEKTNYDAHVMTLVGNYNNGLLLIKNSWGTNWGDNGYAYLDPSVITDENCRNGGVLARSYEFEFNTDQ